jgi:hypothetical protein
MYGIPLSGSGTSPSIQYWLQIRQISGEISLIFPYTLMMGKMFFLYEMVGVAIFKHRCDMTQVITKCKKLMNSKTDEQLKL